MTTNGVNGERNQALAWEVGILNESGKYLTAETFGYKLNVSATSLKKKQLWTIIPDATTESHIFVKSHLNRYLSSDKDGKVSCEAEEPGTEEQFFVEYCPKGTGKWSFKSVAYGYYFTGNEDRLSCFSKSPAWWSVRLAIHPQVHMQNMKRQRYVRLNGDEFHGDQTIPWGYDSLITLEFSQCGKVAVCSRDNRYLNRDGSLSDKVTDDALYGLEIRGGVSPGIAFRDKEGKYLTLIGSTGTLKSKNKAVTKDELFILEISYPQLGLRAHNGKFASTKQGVDLYANQMETGETEIFQLEFNESSKKWKIRCNNGKYWTLSDVNYGVKATGNGRDPSCLFEVISLPSGKVVLKAVNGLFVTSKKLGLMCATGENTDDTEGLFQPVLLNRPIIIFKSEFGLVGTRTNRVECSMSNYEAFVLECVPDGNYILKAGGNKELFWKVGEDSSIKLDGNVPPQQFILQFCSGTHCAIVAPNGRYIRGEQNGLMKADSEEINKSSLWEF